MGSTVTMISPEGRAVDIPAEDVVAAKRVGFRVEETTDRTSRLGAEVKEERSGGVGGALKAGALGIARGVTLGASDIAISGLTSDYDTERVRELREVNPGSSLVGELTGAIAPAILSGGAGAAGTLARVTPAGRLATWSTRGVEAAKASGSTAKALAGSISYVGAEGAAQSAGMYLSDVALGDRELSAEGLTASVGLGFGFGGLAGGATYGVERGYMAARRMFPRQAGVTDKAVKAAEGAWKRESDRIVSAGDSTLTAAKDRLAQLRIAKSEAEVAKMRAQAEGAQALSDQKLTTQRELDRIRLERAQRAGQRRPKPKAGDAPVELPAGAVDEAALDSLAAEAQGARAQSDFLVEARRAGRSVGSDVDLARAADVEIPAAPARIVDTRPGATPPANLEDALRQTKSRIDAGESIGDLSARPVTKADDASTELAEAVTEYEQARTALDVWRAKYPGGKVDRQEAVSSFVSKYKDPRIKSEVSGPLRMTSTAPSQRSRTSRALDTDVFVETSNGRPVPVNAGPGSKQLDEVRASDRIFGINGPDYKVGHSLDAAYDDAIERASLAETPELRDVALREAADIEQEVWTYAATGKPQNAEVIARIQAARDAIQYDGFKVAFRRAEKRALREIGDETVRQAKADDGLAAFLSAMKGQEPNLYKRPDFVTEIDEAAKVLNDYEDAHARLAQAAGDAAHPDSRELATSMQTGADDLERKRLDRTTQTLDEAAERPQVVEPKQGQPEPAPLTPISPPKAAAEGSDLRDSAGRIADLGATLEALQTAGIPGIPDVDRIPLIGPILGAYLKFRALKNVTGMMSGRVPATGNARAAALAARTRDRAAAAVDRMLGVVGRVGAKVKPGAGYASGKLADALTSRLYDDGEPDAPDRASPQEKAAVRAREIARAVLNLDDIIYRVRREMQDVSDPDLVRAAEAAQVRRIQYLAEHAPKEPEPSPFARRKWLPSQAETMRFARRVRAAADPVSVLEDLERGETSPEAAETLRVVFPRMFAEVQQRLLERAPEIEHEVPYQQRVRMSLLFDVPLDPSLDPVTLASLQSVHTTAAQGQQPSGPAQQPSPPMPSIAGPVDLTALYQTGPDKRAARR